MAFDLNGINASAYADYMNQQTSNAASDKLRSTLAGAAEKARSARDADGEGEEINQELMGACKQFEAYFLEQVFKEMQKSVDALKTDSSGSNAQLVNYFKDQTLQDFTQMSTETQGLGFAQMLYENMKHTAGMSAADIEAHNQAIVEQAEEKAKQIAREQVEALAEGSAQTEGTGTAQAVQAQAEATDA